MALAFVKKKKKPDFSPNTGFNIALRITFDPIKKFRLFINYEQIQLKPPR